MNRLFLATACLALSVGCAHSQKTAEPTKARAW